MAERDRTEDVAAWLRTLDTNSNHFSALAGASEGESCADAIRRVVRELAEMTAAHEVLVHDLGTIEEVRAEIARVTADRDRLAAEVERLLAAVAAVHLVCDDLAKGALAYRAAAERGERAAQGLAQDAGTTMMIVDAVRRALAPLIPQ